jgi:hypothetical protein
LGPPLNITGGQTKYFWSESQVIHTCSPANTICEKELTVHCDGKKKPHYMLYTHPMKVKLQIPR